MQGDKSSESYLREVARYALLLDDLELGAVVIVVAAEGAEDIFQGRKIKIYILGLYIYMHERNISAHTLICTS